MKVVLSLTFLCGFIGGIVSGNCPNSGNIQSGYCSNNYAIKAKLNTSAVYSDNQEFRIYGIKEILNDFKNYRDMNTGNRIEASFDQVIVSDTCGELNLNTAYLLMGVENDNDASILEVNDDNGGDAKQWEYVSDNQERWLRKTPSCMNCE